MRKWAVAAALALVGCDDGGSVAMDAAVGGAGGGGGAAGGAGGGGGGGADLPPVTRQNVSGVLTFARDGHLFSADINGGLQQRLTERRGPWSHHAVSPDARSLVAVAADGRAGGQVYVIDVRDQTERRVSLEGCDAGIGGVGWLDDTRVVYAMACGDEPSHLYVASTLTTPAEVDDLLRVDPHDAPSRDVFPAVRTPVFTYVVDRTVCEAGGCVVKPEVWVGETDGNHCKLTDGDPALITGPEGARLGDHGPSFDNDLDSVVFSRNVAGKPAGVEGHFDLMRVGFDLNALIRGQDACATGAVANLSNTLLALETYPDAQGALVVGSERYPDAAAGRGPAGSILYTSEAGDPAVRSLWLVDPGGNRIELTPGDTRLGPARWIVDQYDTSN